MSGERGSTSSRDLLTVKEEARHDRLTRVSNALEEKVLTDWRKLAFKACDDAVRAYWVCRQESGLMVVFKCRKENADMHECIGSRTRDAGKFTAYREARLREAGVSEETIASASSAATAKLMG